jgi:hypothetical protein
MSNEIPIHKPSSSFNIYTKTKSILVALIELVLHLKVIKLYLQYQYIQNQYQI